MLQLDDAAALLERAFAVDVRKSPAATQFVAFAGRDGLRWIVPNDLGASAHVLADWRPYRSASRAGWAALQVAARFGLLPVTPGGRVVHADMRNVAWQSFGWQREHPPHVVTYVGSDGPYQKLVCTLIDRQTHEAVLVLKFAVAEAAKQSLIHEFETLKALAQANHDLGPEPLLIDTASRFATQSYLHGAPEGIELGERHMRFLSCLIHPERRLDLETVRADLLALRDEKAEFLSAGARTTIDESLHRAGWTGSVPATRLHGDFAPWNLKCRPNGAIGAVDWERSVPNDLPYLDLHQFRRQVMESVGRPCTVPWKAYTSELRRHEPNLTDKTAATALTAAAIKYWLSTGWMDAWGDWSA